LIHSVNYVTIRRNRNIEVVQKVNRGEKLDLELETWIDEIMEKQQYRNGLGDMLSISSFFRKLLFNSK